MFKHGKRLVSVSLVVGLLVCSGPAGTAAPRGGALQAFKKWARLYFTVLADLQYYYTAISQEKLLRRSIIALTDSLDQWSYVVESPAGVPPGETIGPFLFDHGFSSGRDSSGFYIQAVVPGSPACCAGLSVGDRLVKIGDLPAGYLSSSEMVGLWFSRVGRKLLVSTAFLERPETVRVTLDKPPPAPPSIIYHGLIGSRIGYVRIASFQPGIADSLYEIISFFKERDARGLVLDLRNAAGGYLDEVVKVAGYFLEEGMAICTSRGRRKTKVYRAGGTTDIVDCPVVVLLNGGSVGAPEVLAAACRDNGKAVIIGEKTPGLCFVQRTSSLAGLEDTYLVLTVALVYSPRGKPLARSAAGKSAGITPDYLISQESPPRLVKRLKAEGLVGAFAAEWLKENGGLQTKTGQSPGVLKSFGSFLQKRGLSCSGAEVARILSAVESCLLARLTADNRGDVRLFQELLIGDNWIAKACEMLARGKSGHSGAGTPGE